MQLLGSTFPGVPDPNLGRSQRSYTWDPVDSLTTQDAAAHQIIQPTADNITWHTVFGVYSPRPPTNGNVMQTHPEVTHDPGWWGYQFNNDWNALRAQGIAYGIYAPHLPAQPVPVVKLYEPGSGFVLPATFMGQPLAQKVRPPGT